MKEVRDHFKQQLRKKIIYGVKDLSVQLLIKRKENNALKKRRRR